MSQQINLYTDAFRKQEKPFSARTMAGSLGLVGLGILAVYAFAFMQTRAAERAGAEATQRLAAQRAQLAAATAQLAPPSSSAALEEEVKRLEGELRIRQAVLASLSSGELGNTQGFSDYFGAFGRQALNGVWLTGFHIGEAGNDLRVQGRVVRPELVPAYLANLNSEPVMRGRRVMELQVTNKAIAAGAAASKDGSVKPPAVEEPARYLEFSFHAPRVLPELSEPAKPPAAAQKGVAK